MSRKKIVIVCLELLFCGSGLGQSYGESTCQDLRDREIEDTFIRGARAGIETAQDFIDKVLTPETVMYNMPQSKALTILQTTPEELKQLLWDLKTPYLEPDLETLVILRKYFQILRGELRDITSERLEFLRTTERLDLLLKRLER